MEDIRAMVDAPVGTGIMAGHQTGGRGRIEGRSWASPPGVNLLFSLKLHVPGPDLARLPLLAGLGLARYLEAVCGLEPAIKWPNDVLVGGRKIAGILAEAVGSAQYLGMGINANQREFSPGLNATSIRLETGSRSSLPGLLERLLGFLATAIGDPDWHQSYEQRLYKKNEEVRLSLGHPGAGESLTGVLVGVDQHGAAILRTARDTRTVFSGEIGSGGTG